MPSLAAALAFEPQVPKQPWIDRVAACVAEPGNYTFDIQYGLPEVRWHSTMQGMSCRKLRDAALLDTSRPPDHGVPLPTGGP